MDKIFLLGSERSGSNLLRTLLGNHSLISAPIAPHLCDVFFNSYEKYIECKGGIDLLVNDLEKYVNHPFNEWNIPKGYFKNKQIYNYKNYIQFYNHCLSLKAKLDNKSAYFSKDNHIHKYAFGIKNVYPDAKFVYLYRDPRDQVASWMRMPIHLHTPFQAINKWLNEQQTILKLKSFYGLNMYLVKYEDLVDDTKSVMSGLLRYLELDIENYCFQTRKENKEADKHPLWENINKPIIKSNYSKYKDILDEKDINMIETLANTEMKKLGYSFETKHNWKKGNKYLFYIKENYLKRNSSKDKKQMKVLLSKQKFQKEMFNKFN